MAPEPFWYVDDTNGVRWAVRVSDAPSTERAGSTITFTSAEQQVSTHYPLQKAQAELARYELLELLDRARWEAVAKPLVPGAGLAAA